MSRGPDRIWRTEIKPYNQVLALTQHMINEGMDNLYKRLETGEEGLVMPEPADCYYDEHTFIDGVVFGPPSVVIDADYANVKSVQLRILMKEGRLQLRKFNGIDPKTRRPKADVFTLVIENWTITVPVDVGFTKLDTETKRGQAIKERSAAKGKPNHSIYELLLDLSTMAVGNAKWSFGDWHEDDWCVNELKKKTRPAGWELGQPRSFVKLDENFQKSMEFLVSQVSNSLTDMNMTSMGFAVMAEDANKRATFEVNDVRYMTYPWTDPSTGNAAPASITGTGRLNYLLYLETIGTGTPPLNSAADSVLSTRLGNWTEGRNPGVDAPNQFGCFKMSSEFFMEQFILPKLSKVNRLMAVDIYSVTTWCDDRVFTQPFKVGATYGVGLGEWTKDGTEFRLKKDTKLRLDDYWQDEVKNFLRPLTESVGDGSNVWSYQDIEWGSTNKNSKSHVGSVEVWMWGDTITFSRLYTQAGKNQIVYEGRTWTKFEYKVDPSILLRNKYGKLIVECKWKITFTLSEVSDGGMKIIVDAEKPTLNYPSTSSDMNSIKDNLQQMYNTAYTNFEYYYQEIRNCLQGQEKFTLPASGVFYFKNPVMDARANLVCDLAYNGNPKLGNPDSTEVRVTRPQEEYVNMPHPASISVEGVCERK